MVEPSVLIPQRSLFKPSEVCAIAKVQPFVLRTWEAEFPDLGARTKGGSRVYRRGDVERVLRLKQLLFVEGLTLAGARRKLEEEQGPAEAEDGAGLDELVGRDVRERLAEVKHGLRALLQMLGRSGQPAEFSLSAPPASHSNQAAAGGRRRASPAQGNSSAVEGRGSRPPRQARAGRSKAGRRPARA